MLPSTASPCVPRQSDLAPLHRQSLHGHTPADELTQSAENEAHEILGIFDHVVHGVCCIGGRSAVDVSSAALKVREHRFVGCHSEALGDSRLLCCLVERWLTENLRSTAATAWKRAEHWQERTAGEPSGVVARSKKESERGLSQYSMR